MMQKSLKLFAILSVVSVASYALSVEIPMYLTNEAHTSVGSITASDTKYGLMFTPKLSGLAHDLGVGIHGFHVHEKASCADMGMAAGGHLDPKKTKTHLGPYNPKGHLGDLPAVYIAADGNLSLPVVAPRLRVKDILGRSLMIHNGGDNYSDEPKPLGGGGPRMVCGVIPSKGI
jgi:Cu-Zn family superoxide dismutase